MPVAGHLLRQRGRQSFSRAKGSPRPSWGSSCVKSSLRGQVLENGGGEGGGTAALGDGLWRWGPRRREPRRRRASHLPRSFPTRFEAFRSGDAGRAHSACRAAVSWGASSSACATSLRGEAQLREGPRRRGRRRRRRPRGARLIGPTGRSSSSSSPPAPRLLFLLDGAVLGVRISARARATARGSAQCGRGRADAEAVWDGRKYEAARRPVGNGAFGIVWRARSAEGETVAIKKVLLDRRYHNRELQMMKVMDHENVVKLRHYFEKQGRKKDEIYLHLVMDFLPETIRSVALQHHKRRKRFAVDHIRAYLWQTFRALEYIHARRICHRDIKPDNLLCDPTTLKCRLCDFGCSKVLVKGQPNVSYICSRYYRAPELMFGATEYAVGVDIWSVGTILMELLLGHLPYQGQDSTQQHLVEIMKLLGTPTDRDLQARGRPPPPPPPAPRRARPRSPRRPPSRPPCSSPVPRRAHRHRHARPLTGAAPSPLLSPGDARHLLRRRPAEAQALPVGAHLPGRHAVGGRRPGAAPPALRPGPAPHRVAGARPPLLRRRPGADRGLRARRGQVADHAARPRLVVQGADGGERLGAPAASGGRTHRRGRQRAGARGGGARACRPARHRRGRARRARGAGGGGGAPGCSLASLKSRDDEIRALQKRVLAEAQRLGCRARRAYASARAEEAPGSHRAPRGARALAALERELAALDEETLRGSGRIRPSPHRAETTPVSGTRSLPVRGRARPTRTRSDRSRRLPRATATTRHTATSVGPRNRRFPRNLSGDGRFRRKRKRRLRRRPREESLLMRSAPHGSGSDSTPAFFASSKFFACLELEESRELFDDAAETIEVPRRDRSGSHDSSATTAAKSADRSGCTCRRSGGPLKSTRDPHEPSSGRDAPSRRDAGRMTPNDDWTRIVEKAGDGDDSTLLGSTLLGVSAPSLSPFVSSRTLGPPFLTNILREGESVGDIDVLDNAPAAPRSWPARRARARAHRPEGAVRVHRETPADPGDVRHAGGGASLRVAHFVLVDFLGLPKPAAPGRGALDGPEPRRAQGAAASASARDAASANREPRSRVSPAYALMRHIARSRNIAPRWMSTTVSRTTNFITPGRRSCTRREITRRACSSCCPVRRARTSTQAAARRRTEGNARVGARADWRVGVPDPVRQAGDGARRGTARRRERVRFAKHASRRDRRRVVERFRVEFRVFRFSEREGARGAFASRDSRPHDRRGGARVSARARARGVRRRAAGVHVLAVAAAAAPSSASA